MNTLKRLHRGLFKGSLVGTAKELIPEVRHCKYQRWTTDDIPKLMDDKKYSRL